MVFPLLAVNGIITVGFQLTGFAVAYTFQFDKVTDLSGALNFIALAVTGLLYSGTYFTRQLVLSSLTIVWGLRLGSFLLYRVLIRGKDDRFNEIRGNVGKFFGFWVFQMVWVFTVSLPVTLTNADHNDGPLNALDYVGWTLWVIGFLCESVADQQKFSHTRQTPPSDPPFLSTGLWSLSRHPNYFGEILLWTGIFLSSVNSMLPYVSMLSPILTALLLLFLSGIPLGEEKSDRLYGTLDSYIRYKRSTSPLIPLPPQLYRRLPRVVKTCLFLELPCYNKMANEHKTT